MTGLIFGGTLIVGSAIWWSSHWFDLEPSHTPFNAAILFLIGVGVCVGSAVSML